MFFILQTLSNYSSAISFNFDTKSGGNKKNTLFNFSASA